MLVREGYATPLTVPPNVEFADRFVRDPGRPKGRPGLWGLQRVESTGVMKMRQSFAQFEEAFLEESQADAARRERLRREAALRSRDRQLEKVHKRGTLRYWVLVMTLIATAVLVTVAMFQALYVVMG